MRKIAMTVVLCLLMGLQVVAQDSEIDALVHFNDGEFPLEWDYPAEWGEPAVYPERVYPFQRHSLDSFIIQQIREPELVSFAPAEAYFFQNDVGQFAILMMIDGDTFWTTEDEDPVLVTVDDFYSDIETFNGYTRLYVDDDIAESLGLREIVFGDETTYSLTQLGAILSDETFPALVFEVGVWEYDFATRTLTDFSGTIYSRRSEGWLGTFLPSGAEFRDEFTVLALPFIFREAYRQFTFPPDVDAEWLDENPNESAAVMRVWYDTSYIEDGNYESIPDVLDFMIPNFVEAEDIEIITDTVTLKEYEYTYLGLYGFRQECKVTYELIVPATLRSDPVYSSVGICVFNDDLATYEDVFNTVQTTLTIREDLQ